MNAKNLPLKFSFVALVVAVCLWSVKSEGLRQGIDLRGGHSLVFEIRTNQVQIDRLKEQKKGLEKDLETASPETSQDIKDALSRIEADLKRYKAQGVSSSNLPEKMISVLKERVDPQGLRSLEWRPLGDNRFEVRMPAGREETTTAKNAYMSAVELLEEGNLQRSEIRRVLQTPPRNRDQEIARLVGQDVPLAKALKELARSSDEMARAEKKLEAVKAEFAKAVGISQPANRIEALRKAMEQAVAAKENQEVDYEIALENVEETNVSLQELNGILVNYLSDSEQKALGKKGQAGRKEIATRLQLFKMNLEALRSKHPARMGEIDNVVGLYKEWSQRRQRLDDPSDLKRLIAKAGVLEFRIAPFSPDGGSDFKIGSDERDRYVELLNREGPEGLRRRNERLLWFPISGEREGYGGLITADYAGQQYLLLYNQPGYQMLHEGGVGGWSLSRAFRDSDKFARLAIGFEFDEGGAKRMANLTAAHQTHCMAILLDDEVFSAPRISEGAIISKRGIITGSFTANEIDEMVRILEAGSLPAKLNPEPVSENTFGPAIGEINREKGMKAALFGLIAVAAFMLIYYLLCGFIANVALLLNIILVLGTMSLLSAVFTLPGIAGLILTIGIAVDANVLIFERLREEQAKGQSIRMALKNAYERAFSAIFDANITTLITCLILGWVGTEEVRGFAITLGLGVAFSMFTSLVVTRWVFQLLLDSRALTKPVFMLHIIGTPKVNWMAKRHFFWVLSAVMMVMGIVSLIRQGGDIWGIEFSSGTKATLTFTDDALIDGQLPDDGLVRRRFINVAREDGYDKLVSTARVEKLINPDHVRNFLRDHDSDADGAIALAEWKAQKLNEEFFGTIDADGDGMLVRDELVARLPAASYQVSTTETDVSRIRRVAAGAFGNALAQRIPCKFTLAKGGRSAELGVAISPDGLTRITPALVKQAKAVYRDDLLDFQGGLLLVIREVTPALSKTELEDRIEQMRSQPDFIGQMFNLTDVVPLSPAEGQGYSALAVIVRPMEASAVERADAWAAFADSEAKLITEALEREEAMVVRSFDAAIAGEAAQLAIVAVVLSWLAIVAYLWLRFGSVQWGLAAVICLIHDVVIVIGMVGASSWLHNTALGQLLGIESFKIDLAMVAAILTVIGYSVNDSIVVFDRIRENRGKLTTVSSQVIDMSINQTLSRTLLTSGTTLIVVGIMYVWGGPGIHAFSYALLVGVVFGTYSSVAVASPLLMGFKRAMVAKTAAAAD